MVCRRKQQGIIWMTFGLILLTAEQEDLIKDMKDDVSIEIPENKDGYLLMLSINFYIMKLILDILPTLLYTFRCENTVSIFLQHLVLEVVLEHCAHLLVTFLTRPL